MTLGSWGLLGVLGPSLILCRLHLAGLGVCRNNGPVSLDSQSIGFLTFLSIYILYPRLYDSTRTHKSITKNEWVLWIDSILIPALTQIYPAAIIQELPPSDTHISLNATAASVEYHVGSRERTTYPQDFHYFLPPAGLATLYDEISRRIQEPGIIQLNPGQPLSFRILNSWANCYSEDGRLDTSSVPSLPPRQWQFCHSTSSINPILFEQMENFPGHDYVFLCIGTYLHIHLAWYDPG